MARIYADHFGHIDPYINVYIYIYIYIIYIYIYIIYIYVPLKVKTLQFFGVGIQLHVPHEVEKKLLAMMTMQKVVAWGECGLDYFDKKTRGQALDFFKKKCWKMCMHKQMVST